MRVCIIALIVSLLPILVSPATIHVPDNQPTIQAGIDSASVGDTVLVGDGIFTGDGNRDLDFGGKAIVLTSENGPAATIIDCDGSAETPYGGFYFHSEEDSVSVVQGFTVRHGFGQPVGGGGASAGGAVACDSGSAPLFLDCVFDSNSALLGGAVFASGANPVFRDCLFTNNIGGIYGGASFCSESTPVFVNCTFSGNQSPRGGGIYCSDASPLLNNCSVVSNRADYGGGISLVNSSPISTNTTFAYNRALYGGVVNDGNPYFDSCLFAGNEAAETGAVVYGGRPEFEFCVMRDNSAGPSGGCISAATPVLTNCTMFRNTVPGGVIDVATASVTNCIVTFNLLGPAVSGSSVTLKCSDIFGNEGGDWQGDIADQLGTNGNFSVDPMFCDSASGEVNLWYISPCLAKVNDCGLVGGRDVGCDGITLPVAARIEYTGNYPAQIVRTLTPGISWIFADLDGGAQTRYELEIGTDQDWQSAEMWATGTVMTSDTSVVYDGLPLTDRGMYYLRLRLAEGDSWGSWMESNFTVRLVYEEPEPSDWPMFRHDAQHTGRNDATHLSPPLALRWQRHICDCPLNPVSTYGDKVLATPGKLVAPAIEYPDIYCLSASDGEIVWQQAFSGVWDLAQATAGLGMWYEHVDAGYNNPPQMIAYDLNTGDTTWILHINQQSWKKQGPTLHDGLLFFESGTYGGMSAVDALSGKQIWWKRLAQLDCWAAAVYDDVAYTFLGEYLNGHDVGTGAGLFAVYSGDEPCPDDETGFGDPFTGYYVRTATVVDTGLNMAFCVYQTVLDAFDLQTRELVWRHCGEYRSRTEGKAFTPAIWNGLVFAITEGRLQVYDGPTGDKLWSYESDFPYVFPAVIADGYVILSTNTSTHGVNLITRREEWSLPIGGYVTPANDRLYVASVDGNLYAYGDAPTDVDDERADDNLPKEYALSQNYPNPFNPNTTIAYALPKRSHVKITVINILGQEVVTLLNEDKPAGQYTAVWAGVNSNGRPVATGVYFYRITAGDYIETKKMLLLK